MAAKTRQLIALLNNYKTGETKYMGKRKESDERPGDMLTDPLSEKEIEDREEEAERDRVTFDEARKRTQEVHGGALKKLAEYDSAGAMSFDPDDQPEPEQDLAECFDLDEPPNEDFFREVIKYCGLQGDVAAKNGHRAISQDWKALKNMVERVEKTTKTKQYWSKYE